MLLYFSSGRGGIFHNLHSLLGWMVLLLIGDQEVIWDFVRILRALDGVLRLAQVLI